MLPLEKPPDILESALRHSEIGKRKERSNVSEDPIMSDTMILPVLENLQTTNNLQNPEKNLFMPESLQQNRKEIWNVRSSLCWRNSLDTKLYKTSVLELIGNDPDCVPFYNSAWQEKYRKLSLPIETDFQDWPLNSLSSSLLRQEQNSWFKTQTKVQKHPTKNLVKICYPLCTSSLVENTENESIKKEEPKKKRQKKSEKVKENGKVIRCRKIRIRMNKETKERARKMVGCFRYLYNKTLQLDKDGEIDGASSKEMKRVRTSLTKQENYTEEEPWLDDLPTLGKQQAFESYFIAKKTQMKRVITGDIQSFEMKKKSKYRDPQEYVPLERHAISFSKKVVKTCIDRKPFEFRVIGKMPKEFKCREDTSYTRTEIKLVKNRLGQWFLSIPIELDPIKTTTEDVCSLDPGVRTFQTMYSTDGTISKIGSSFDNIKSILKRADLLQQYKDTHKELKSRRKRGIKRRMLRLQQQVRNRIKDLHHKVSGWLCRNYRIILLPSFETQQMTSNLSSPINRALLTWSHYAFKQRLIDRAQCFTHTKVRVVNEAFTTKTCGNCGVVYENVGSSEVFQCGKCSLCADRDEHAARNVMLRQ